MKISNHKMVKKFLIELAEMGDKNATLLLVAFEIENRRDNAVKYPDIKNAWNLAEDACKAYLRHCMNYNMKCGKIKVDEGQLPYIIIGTLPNGNTIAYRCSEDLKWHDVPLYQGGWDYQCDNNRRKIEQNIIELYEDCIRDYLSEEDDAPSVQYSLF